MLILSRKRLETITIGDSVEISVQAIQGNRVRIGIKAPEAIKVVRGELHKRDNRFDSMKGTDE